MKKANHPRAKNQATKKITNEASEELDFPEPATVTVTDEEFKELIKEIIGDSIDIDSDGIEQLKESVRKYLSSSITII